MSSDLLAIFAAAVRMVNGVPEDVKAAAERAHGFELCDFEYTYLEFLDQQIDLAPRGPECAELLKRRRQALAPFCGQPLIQGHIDVNRDLYYFDVDPSTGKVVHWEEYKDWIGDGG